MTIEEKIIEINNIIDSMTPEEFINFIKSHMISTVHSLPEEGLDQLLEKLTNGETS